MHLNLPKVFQHPFIPSV